MHPRVASPLLLSVVWLFGCGFPPTLVGCTDTCDTEDPATTTNDLPTTSGVVLTDTSAETSAGTEQTSDAETTTASTTTEPPGPPAILEREVIPKFTDVNMVLAVTVETEYADGVRMQLETGAPIELLPAGPDVFTGTIDAFTALANGQHFALFTPRRANVIGEPASADYFIALPGVGSEVAWDTTQIDGHIAALAVLPDGRPVELGTFDDMGTSRCYLRRREKDGTPGDFIPVLPEAECTATDLEIDRDTGVIHILVERNGGQGLRWWAGELASWGAGPKNIGMGETGETALALASRPGLVAVCGAQAVDSVDKTDALAVLLRPGQTAERKQFDYKPPGEPKSHVFGETARDCAFWGDTLVLAGEAHGQHEAPKDVPQRDRLTLATYELGADEASWMVAGPNPGVQSRALALDIDDQGNRHLAGYTCLDLCAHEGDVRVYSPEGALISQIPLGPLGSDWFGPHAIAWSPAGYAVIALGAQQGPNSVFKVQALAPGVITPLWTFTPNDKQGLQMALAVAVGEFGEVYAGGLAETSHPAFVVIGG